MPRLEDLNKNLLEMTPDELRQRIKEIRQDRIIRKSKAPTAKAVKEKAAKKDTLRSALDGMTPEQLEELFKGLSND